MNEICHFFCEKQQIIALYKAPNNHSLTFHSKTITLLNHDSLVYVIFLYTLFDNDDNLWLLLPIQNEHRYEIHKTITRNVHEKMINNRFLIFFANNNKKNLHGI